MIELKISPVELSPAHRIMSITETVLEHDFPLIRFGITELGFTVIVLTVDFDEDTNGLRYLYVPVSSKLEREYRDSQLTLRDIILQSPWLSLVETDEMDESQRVYEIPSNELPLEYLPKEGSFIPKSYLKKFHVQSVGSYDLKVKLDGRNANNHMVESNQLNKICESVSRQFSQTISLLKQNDHIKIYQKIPEAASYDIVFSLVQEGEFNAFLSFEDLCLMVEKILGYLTVDFTHEYNLLLDSGSTNVKFNQLATTIFDKVHNFYSAKEKFEEELKKTVFSAGMLFSELPCGESFTSISFLRNDNLIGCLDETKKYTYVKATNFYKGVLGLQLINNPRTQYKILIYTLNIKTKKGKAILVDQQKFGGREKVVNFKIEGINTLTHSKYTQALDSGEWIYVIGDLVEQYNGELNLTIFHE